MVFHLLSPEDNRGHRTYLAQKPFKHFSVTLFDGTEVAADRPTASVGALDVTVRHAEKPPVSAHIPVEEDNSVRIPSGKLLNQYRAFIKELSSLDISIHLLPDNRRTWEETAEGDQGIVALASSPSERELAHRYLAFRRRDDTQEASLTNAIGRFTEWARQQALRGSNIGVASANTIYSDIITQIGSRPIQSTSEDLTPRIEGQIATLEEHSLRADLFSKFGILYPLPILETIQALRRSDPSSRPVLVNILQPYIHSVQARLDALQGIYDSLQAFVDNINRFYRSKTLSFDLQHGLVIKALDGTSLDPNSLSSGERQLLLLLCNAVSAQDKSTIFIIDEPELSLNVKWQRGLIQAILDCVKQGNVQLLLATHSLELLARHRRSVAKLSASDQPH
jgi:hypothetical protein